MADPTPYTEAVRVLLSLSVIALLGIVGAYLALTRPSSTAKRLTGLLLGLYAARESFIFAYVNPDLSLRPYTPPHLFYWNDVTLLIHFTTAALLWFYPSRPAWRSWHTPLFAAALAWNAAAAYVWFAEPRALITGWPTSADGSGWTMWYLLLLREVGPDVALLALLVSALTRASRLDARAARTAYAFLALLFSGHFGQIGWYLRSLYLLATGQSDYALTYLWDYPGDCCHILRWVSELRDGYLVLALVLAFWKRSLVALGVIVASFAATFLLVLGPFDYFTTAFLVPAVGTLYVVNRGGLFGGPNVPVWVQVLLSLAVAAAVFLAVASFLVTITRDPLGLAVAGFVGLLVAAGSALLVFPQTPTLFGFGFGGSSDDTARRVAAYRTALQAELATGAHAQEVSTKLRPLRAHLGISERDHALLELTLGAVRGSPAPRLDPGTLFLNRYRITRPAGPAGPAVAHLGVDEAVGRHVVLKRLRGFDVDSAELDEVLREARALGSLQHPNVVTLYDVERVGDEIFLVMEYLEGGSLADRLTTGPLPPDAFAGVVRDLLAGLDAVHGASLVHRDVKPSNVLFDRAGRAKLADFGVAHVPGFETTVASGRGGDAAVGTIRFMSPEQARGRTVDARSDLYSAAATLYEAHAGRPLLPPRAGETAVELQLRAAEPRPAPDDVGGGAALAAWFQRALDPRLEARFSSAREMRDAFEAAYTQRGRADAGAVSPGGTRGGSGRRRSRRRGAGAPAPRGGGGAN